jgi:hypothetical protein
MTRADAQEAIFGTFDGATSAVGVVGASVIAGVPASSLIVAAVGLAVASMVGMGAGQWLSDTTPAGRIRRAVVMAAATLVGSLLPVVPFIVGGGRTANSAAAAIITLGVGGVIAELRPGPRVRTYAVTFLILLLASALAVGAGAIAGAAA